jgi:pimeloyl-ACP methyl ester carboxylesterase
MGTMNSTPYEKRSVVSRDGTTIGYRQMGSCPGLVLVHGGMQASQNFMKLAAALADQFTVCVLDRRGRGLSGPFGDDYGLERECEDLQAVLLRTNTHFVIGLSSGALICLQAALIVPEIGKAALYEPPLPVNGSSPASWVGVFDAEIAKGDLSAALVTALKGTKTSRVLGLIPRFILVPLMRHAIRVGDPPRTIGDDVHPLALIPTMRYDAQLVREMEGRLEQFRDVAVEVLLLGGTRSPSYLRHALDVLAGILPECSRVKLSGVGHTAADNGGKPELVARELRRFFGTPVVGVT